jgi:FMN phosphatase YigB (HAD superfamily)
MPITAVTFDLWDTLYIDDRRSDQVRRAARQRLVASFLAFIGSPVSSQDLSEALGRAEESADRVWRTELRTVGAAARIAEALGLLGVRASGTALALLVPEVERVALQHPPQLHPLAAAVLGRLSSRYRLAVISDTGQTSGRVLRQLLARDGLLGTFSALVFSDELGVAKPHPRPFQHALTMMEVPRAEDAVHVGDNEATDVDGALNVGMRMLHLTRTGPAGQMQRAGYRAIEDLSEVPSAIRTLPALSPSTSDALPVTAVTSTRMPVGRRGRP